MQSAVQGAVKIMFVSGCGPGCCSRGYDGTEIHFPKFYPISGVYGIDWMVELWLDFLLDSIRPS